MKFGFAILACAMAVPCVGNAACEQYDFAELKAMKKNDLEFAYCISLLESRKAQIHAEAAEKIENIDSQQYQPNPSALAKNGRLAAQAAGESEQCDATISKIARQIEARHMSVEKVRASCNIN